MTEDRIYNFSSCWQNSNDIAEEICAVKLYSKGILLQ